jgi:hypothetical protein
MLVSAIPVHTTAGDLELRVYRGGRVWLGVAATGEVVTQGGVSGTVRAANGKLALVLEGMQALHIPFASAAEAEAAAGQVRRAAALKGTIVPSADLVVAEEDGAMHALEPLFHITDIERLAPVPAFHLLRALLLPSPSPPSGYMVLPLPEDAWVEYKADGAGAVPLLVPGPVAVVVWRRGADQGGEGAAAAGIPQRAADLEVIIRRLKSKAAGAF